MFFTCCQVINFFHKFLEVAPTLLVFTGKVPKYKILFAMPITIRTYKAYFFHHTCGNFKFKTLKAQMRFTFTKLHINQSWGLELLLASATFI